MGQYAKFLEQQQNKNTQVTATLTLLELPNLFALLEGVQESGDAKATIALTTRLYSLLQWLGRPRLLKRVGTIRDGAAAALGDHWNHSQFEAQRTGIEQQLSNGQLPQAHAAAMTLLKQARTVGDKTYLGADYDLATACWLLARILERNGAAEHALPLFDEARQYFEAIEQHRPGYGAARMASTCIADGAGCILDLGRHDEAAAAYEEHIRHVNKFGNDRNVAVGKGQLGTVRLLQRRYPEALAAYQEARETFTRLNEPGSVATSWHQIGLVYQEMGAAEEAENAYRKALAIEVQLGNVTEQADTLNQLGNLYINVLGRSDEALAFHRQAANKYVEYHDTANEGRVRGNLANTLHKLRRFDEARQEIHRAIECDTQFGHATEPWISWDILADIETASGTPAAAAEARQQAITAYLAYRRDGGENHYPDGRIALAVTQTLANNGPAAAAVLLQQAPDFVSADVPSFIPALQGIVSGSRDRRLADAPDLDFAMAAEILLLIETLEREVDGR